MDAQKTLAVGGRRRRVVIDDFKIIDAVERAPTNRVAPAFVAAKVERQGRVAHAVAIPFVNSAVSNVCVRLTR